MWQWLKGHKLAVAGSLLLLLLSATAILVPVCSAYSYSDQNAHLQNAPASLIHLFGTDKFGRDIFVRTWYAARISLMIGLGSMIVNGVIGVLYGGIAGYAGGKTDFILMGAADIIVSIPSLLYVILITLTLGQNAGSILLGICISGWIGTARVVRGEVRRMKQMEFVSAARLAGVPRRIIFFRHLLFNAAGPIIVNLTFQIPQAIFTEAFLSFVGVGIEAPAASLGTLIREAKSQIQLYPAQMLYPILILCLLILAVNLIGIDLERSFKIRKEGLMK